MTELQTKLEKLTRNLWWTWKPEVRGIFRDLDREAYRQAHSNPVRALKGIDHGRIRQRVEVVDIVTRVDRALRQLEDYLHPISTWGMIHAGPLQSRPVAFFCAEFGIHESIPIYSGGLGILAGDFLKGASDLGVPLVGVGLLYHHGYTTQQLDGCFWQHDFIERFEAADLPLDPALGPGGEPVRVGVELPGRTVWAKVLEAKVGRVRLFLLDTRDEANGPEDAALAAHLYGGDQRMRIQQELLLGVGGSRALRALGITPSVLHLNEGHSAFAILERARHRVRQDGLDPWAALHEAASATVFTTHTPVEAGHDRFPADLAGEHLAPLAQGLGLGVQDLLRLGRLDPGDPSGDFLPTVLALRHSRRANGVSALHGTVARSMWEGRCPGRPAQDVPVGHITNGVHVPTWLSAKLDLLFQNRLGVDWARRIASPALWTGVEAIDPAELWEIKTVLKGDLLRMVRERVAEMRARAGLPALDPPPLVPRALTLGFARRFVTYKRPDLLFTDLDRLDRLVNHPEHPVNLIFAGRSHPQDGPGKAIIQSVGLLAEDARFRDRIVFVENHNIRIGRALCQGVDAWLNTPRRPMEACGTSGMKAILNGALHISTLDGWWAEAYDGANGFALGTGEVHASPEVQDRRDAEALFRVLEEQVVPLYYDQDDNGVPRRWLRTVQRSLRTLAWRYNAERMVMDYVRTCYLPAGAASSCQMPD